MRTEAPLLAPVFRSDGQARLLAEFLLTGDELSLTDLSERSDLAYATVHREAERLLDAGILQEKQVGRSRLVSANSDSPLVDPLRQILLVSTGPKVLLTEALRHVEGITSAFIYGSFAARMTGVPRRLEAVPVDDDRAESFLVLARDTLIDVAHAVGEALLARHGYRTRSGPGQPVRPRLSCGRRAGRRARMSSSSATAVRSMPTRSVACWRS